MRLEDIKFPELKDRELKILTKRHAELKGQEDLTTVQKFEKLLAGCLVAKATQGEKPWKTALNAWGVIWCTLTLEDEWRSRDYEEMSVVFRVATTNVMELLG